MADKEIVVNPQGMGELNKENILAFLHSFKARTGMYVSEPKNYDMVASFLRGYMYCCYLHGYTSIVDFGDFPRNDNEDAASKFIDFLIEKVSLESC